jgi:hypothetical protein
MAILPLVRVRMCIVASVEPERRHDAEPRCTTKPSVSARRPRPRDVAVVRPANLDVDRHRTPIIGGPEPAATDPAARSADTLHRFNNHSPTSIDIDRRLNDRRLLVTGQDPVGPHTAQHVTGSSPSIPPPMTWAATGVARDSDQH